ncbi:hypothetical protein IL306_000625 [Fusarium sp. DS 682]|nr:hypothetical protein IL306_000625 [Fusarium sp. DS 682]
MDGLSLAASVVAVIQLTGSCLKLSRRWLGPSEFSSTDLATVTMTLYAFTGAIKTFQTHLEIHEDDQVRLSSLEHLSRVLERSAEALDVVRSFLDKGGFIGKHLIGPKFDRKLKASLKALEAAKELFGYALHADHQTILLGVERYIRNLSEDLRDFQDGVNTSLKRLHENGDETYEEVKRARREHQESISRIQAVVDRQDARGNDEERQVILDWLTAIDYAPQQNDFINRRQSGTGQWLLDSAEYRAWLNAKGKTLFCPGIPGAGKTILTSIVVGDLGTRFSKDPTVGLAYIYCNFQRQNEQKVESLLANLLKQVAERQFSPPESLKALYDQHKHERTHPSFDEVSSTFQSVVAIHARVFVVVDAVDECQASDRCRAKFLSELFNIQARYGINLLVTSRFIPEIVDRFRDAVTLEIRANNEDVERYIEGHWEQLPSFVQRNRPIQEEIKAGISNAVDGMFLLAEIYLGLLDDKVTPRAIRKAVQGFQKQGPASSEDTDAKVQVLAHAYRQAMERINGQKPGRKKLAMDVLAWITCAKRPLTTVELQHALAVEAGEAGIDEENIPHIEEIVSVCSGLVTVDRESDIIRLVHYTTQEYFERAQEEWFPDADLDITTTCATYLSFNTFSSGFCQTDDEFEERLRSNPLYDYAAHNWGAHACQLPGCDQVVVDFLTDTTKTEAAGQALMAAERSWRRHYSQYVPKQITGLHLAACLGLNEAVCRLIRHWRNVEPKDSYERTPLSWAAQNGHEAVVQLLIAMGEIEVNAKDLYGRTPLSWAARNGHEAVVKLLVATGKADINAKDSCGQTPLLWAARNGHEAIVQLLLAIGKVDVNTGDNIFETPLLRAAENRHEAVTQLLLATGKVNIDVKDGSNGRMPLSWVTRNGHKVIFKQLLATGKVIVDVKDSSDGRTPL